MTAYDAEIIQTFADKTYARANSIIMLFTIVAGACGCVMGVVLSRQFPQINNVGLSSGCIIFIGIIGYVAGSAYAFRLKFQAQTALCRMQIEKNTRNRIKSDLSENELAPAKAEKT